MLDSDTCSSASELAAQFRTATASFQMVYQGRESQQIAVHPESGNLTKNDWRDERSMSEIFPGVDIGKVHFNRRQRDCRKRVTYGHACMGVCARVDQYPIAPIPTLVNLIDNHTLVVALDSPEFHLVFLRKLLEFPIDIIQCGGAVNSGLA